MVMKQGGVLLLLQVLKIPNNKVQLIMKALM